MFLAGLFDKHKRQKPKIIWQTIPIYQKQRKAELFICLINSV